MSKKGINQLQIIDQVERKRLTQKHGAEILGLSVRQMRRKQNRYRLEGIGGLKHKLTEKKGNNGISNDTKSKIIKLVKEKYSDYGPTLISEKLEEKHDIKIDHETLRRLLISEDLWESKKRKKTKRVWRERKHCEGEMVQADGSRHIWLANDNYIDLLALIDDATGKIYIKFGSESTKDFAQFFREFVEERGIPQQFYCDRGKVFKVNNSKDKSDRQTQFKRMLEELDIKTSFAYSPQAKGRIERLFRTLQDRLEKELRENNVKTLELANKFLKESKYIERFNERFGVEAKSEAVVYKSIENYDLNSIFCKKYYRKINNDNTIQFKQNWYQLLKKQPVNLQVGTKIEVRVYFDETIGLFKNGKKLNCNPIEKRKEKPIREKVYSQVGKSRKPDSNHPWKRWVEKEKKPDISTESKRGHF